MTIRVEPGTLAAKPPTSSTGVALSVTPRLFNAGFAMVDAQGVPQPYLAERLPQLGTDSWRVAADGKMETTYPLRPNLTWHDGAPMSAEDFAFAWRVYMTPDYGYARITPLSLISEVSAPDSRTVLLKWSRPFPDAYQLSPGNLQALPRHLLESKFEQMPPEVFASIPYWTNEYVGMGPFKLSRWEPGAFVEGEAFDGHALGRPKIGRVRLLPLLDFNSVLATMLAGEADAAVDDSFRFEQAAILRRSWAPTNGGQIFSVPSQGRWSEIQHRPEYANPRSILDVRVRRALAHTVDKEALSEGLFNGEGILSDSFIPPGESYFAEAEKAIVKYPLDLRRAEQLMAEAGYTRGSDGVWLHPSQGRFSGEMRVNATTQSEREMAIMGSGWQHAGFEFKQVPISESQGRLGEVRGTFPTIYTGGGGSGPGVFGSFISSSITRPQNNWVGSNRGGYSNSDLDRLYDTFTTTLDLAQRDRLAIQMAKVFTEDVGAISLFFNPVMSAFVSDLTGPAPRAAGANAAWDVHNWEWRWAR